MKLVVDDRERSVIKHLEQLAEIEIKRLTVGDYAFVRDDGTLIVVVERKTLNDLASSIKDGRMDNNDKLIQARELSQCRILYMIEGSSYPSLNKKFSGLPYKCLQGKLDNLMFRHGVDIIWTKDEQHTASRLAGLLKTLNNLVSHYDKTGFEQVTGKTLIHVTHTMATDDSKQVCNVRETNPRTPDDTTLDPGSNPNVDTTLDTTLDTNTSSDITHINEMKTVDDTPLADSILQSRHELSLDVIHVKMLAQLPSVSFATAKVALQKYTFRELLTGNIDVHTLSNLTYDSNFRLGERGAQLYNLCQRLSKMNITHTHTSDFKYCIKMLSCIRGITIECARDILSTVSLHEIVNTSFSPGDIADIKKKSGRKMGKALESRISLTFS